MRKHFCPLFLLASLLCGALFSRAGDAATDLNRARTLETAGKYDQAMAIYRAVLQTSPQSLVAHAGSGRACYHARQYPDAAGQFGQALKLSPGNAELVEWLARSELANMQPQKAIDLIQAENAVEEDSASAHLLLAHAYDAQDKLDDARSEIGRALALDPRCKGAHFALGFIAWTMRDLAVAEDEFKHELALDSHEYMAFYYLAETLELEGKLEDAWTVLKRMGAEAPETYLHHFAVGKWNERQKDFAAAAKEFRAAIQLDPQPPEAHYHLAVTLRKLGQTAEATEEFERSNQLRTMSSAGPGQGMGQNLGQGMGQNSGQGMGQNPGQGMGQGTGIGQGMGQGMGQNSGQGMGQSLGMGQNLGQGMSQGMGMGQGMGNMRPHLPDLDSPTQ